MSTSQILKYAKEKTCGQITWKCDSMNFVTVQSHALRKVLNVINVLIV